MCAFLCIFCETGPESIRKMYTHKSLLMYTCCIHIYICVYKYAFIERGRKEQHQHIRLVVNFAYQQVQEGAK